MNFILFEDSQFQNLLPLVYFRPVWELLCGVFTIEERINNYIDGNCFYLARNYLQKNYLSEEKGFLNSPDDSSLFINGRWLLAEEDARLITELSSGEALIYNNTLLAFRGTVSDVKEQLSEGIPDSEKIINSMNCKEHKGRVVEYLWEIIEWNGDYLNEDLKFLGKGGQMEGSVSKGVYLVAEENIYISKTAQVKPGVVIDASDGPVWIDEGVKIMPNATLQGPIYIGKNSLVKIGAKLYENTTIGPVCKVGGEIEGSIIQGYSNKQHDGFLGHAYLGSWINIGADTNNSDLKNNYGKIQVFLNGNLMNTGKQFLGLIMGDHSKTAINTMFNTGTIVGVNCNVFGTGMPPKFIPSFSWGGAEKLVEYRLDKSMEVAKLVMSRRKVSFTDKEEKLFMEVKKLANKVEKISLN